MSQFPGCEVCDECYTAEKALVKLNNFRRLWQNIVDKQKPYNHLLVQKARFGLGSSIEAVLSWISSRTAWSTGLNPCQLGQGAPRPNVAGAFLGTEQRQSNSLGSGTAAVFCDLAKQGRRFIFECLST